MLEKQFIDLINQNKPQEALQVSKLILDQNPSSAHYYFNHAMLAKELGLREETARVLRLAVKKRPNCPVMHRMLSDACNALCLWKEGFEHAQWRFDWPLEDGPNTLAPIPSVMELMPRFRAAYKKPYWNGKDSLKDKTILIFNEAGFGDCIQNIRYAKYINAKKVILEVKPELHRLLKSSNGIDETIILDKEKRFDSFLETFSDKKSEEQFPEHDYVVSVQTLPYYFDPNLDNIPDKFPYIFSETGCCEGCKYINSNKLRVGIAWAGNEKDYNDRHRSCWLKNFRHLQMPGVQLYSLQKGRMKRTWIVEPEPDHNVDLLEDSEGIDIIDLAPYIKDFHDTAEILKHLDLIISVDTALVHLAGAMNRPVWMLNSHLRHDMRWTLKWYDSLWIIHQEQPGDWEGLLRRVGEELKTIA